MSRAGRASATLTSCSGSLTRTETAPSTSRFLNSELGDQAFVDAVPKIEPNFVHVMSAGVHDRDGHEQRGGS